MRPASLHIGKIACLSGLSLTLSLSTACEDEKSAPGFDSFMDFTVAPDARVLPGRDGGASEAGADGGEAAQGAVDASFNTVDDAALGGDARSLEGTNWDSERLLIVEASSPRVHVLDVATKEVIHTFGLTNQARVFAGSSGRIGYLATAGEARVIALDIGLSWRTTAAGKVAELVPPRLLDKELLGSDVLAPNSFAGTTTLFFPNEARAMGFDELSLLERFTPVQIAAGAAHQGTGIAWRDGYLVSARDAGQTDAVLTWRDAAGVRDTSRSFDCVAPGAAVRSGKGLAVSCANGVLRWWDDADAPSLVPYPENVARASKLVGHPIEATFIALAGDHVCALRDVMTCTQSAAPVLDIALDGSGKRALALRRDGVLSMYDPVTLKPFKDMRVTSDAPANTPAHALPAMAVGALFLYVSDPVTRRIHTIHPSTYADLDAITLPFAPSGLAQFQYVR